eukprot:gene19807-25751_t
MGSSKIYNESSIN